MHMEEHFFYQEEIYFTKNSSRELGENQDKIVELLRSNLAVGVVGGFFEEGYPVYFISHFALNNLGMSFEEFMDRTGGSFLKAIYEEDAFWSDTECIWSEKYKNSVRLYPVWPEWENVTTVIGGASIEKYIRVVSEP